MEGSSRQQVRIARSHAPVDRQALGLLFKAGPYVSAALFKVSQKRPTRPWVWLLHSLTRSSDSVPQGRSSCPVPSSHVCKD